MLLPVILTIIYMTCKQHLSKIAFFALLSLSVSGCRDDAENPEAVHSEMEMKSSMVDSLTMELQQQQKLNDSLQQAVETNFYANDYSVFFGKEYEDIDEPEAYISEALKKQKDLIPLKSVLGGNMEFRQVQVISEEWVLAIYDDGHVQGKSIFAYELQEDGEVKFTEVATKLPE